jgi:hypothetical protein
MGPVPAVVKASATELSPAEHAFTAAVEALRGVLSASRVVG